jgi:hypothetical protein
MIASHAVEFRQTRTTTGSEVSPGTQFNRSKANHAYESVLSLLIHPTLAALGRIERIAGTACLAFPRSGRFNRW